MYQTYNKKERQALQDLFNQGRTYYKSGKVADAAIIFKELAEKEHTGAYIFLGDCYFYGRGVPHHPEKSVECFVKSGRVHFPSAGANGMLPNLYSQIEWCRKAAKEGHLIAQYKVVNNSEISDNPNFEEAFIWYQKAAELGYAPAQYNLGWYYENGNLLGVEQDFTKAAGWFEKAAEQGFLQAQVDLSRYYAEGKGVPQDMEKANALREKFLSPGFSKLQFKKFDMEIGDTISAGAKGSKKRVYMLLTCQCTPNINCCIAANKMCYMDAFGCHVENRNRLCFNNVHRKTIKEIMQHKHMAENKTARVWKYIDKHLINN